MPTTGRPVQHRQEEREGGGTHCMGTLDTFQQFIPSFITRALSSIHYLKKKIGRVEYVDT